MEGYCFVIPRYWTGIAGGAETLCGQLAENLVKRGERVSIATTCAKDNRSWENSFSPGITKEAGIDVYRFPVAERDLERWIPLQIKISENRQLTIDEQLDWMQHSVNSPQLYEFIRDNRDSFKNFFFGPYLFGTTFWGSQIHPDKSYLVPCLHDEEYAYLDITREMFRHVKGCLFNAKAEQKLADKLYGKINGTDVGMGFVLEDYNRQDYLVPYFEDNSPYILYFGRKETGKNVHVLIDYFIKFKESLLNEEIEAEKAQRLTSLKLVIAGGGDFKDLYRDKALERQDIIDIGHVSEVDKKRLMSQALYLCQPSLNESFSIVIMEAWLLGTPVLVHANCAVTRQHVIDSKGGLYFADYYDLKAIIEESIDNQKLLKDFAYNGESYVKSNYNWDRIIEKFYQALNNEI